MLINRICYSSVAKCKVGFHISFAFLRIARAISCVYEILVMTFALYMNGFI